MNRQTTVWLVVLFLLLAACARPAPQPTPVAVQPTVTPAATETMQPTGTPAATPTAAPTATPTPDLAAIWQQTNQGGDEATAGILGGIQRKQKVCR